MKSILCLTLAAAGLAAAGNPTFPGTWTGSGTVSYCHRNSLQIVKNITLRVSDQGYKGAGEVFAYLSIEGVEKGIVVLDYNGPRKQLESNAVSRPQGGLLGKTSPYADFWFTLDAQDPWRGFGNYMTLKGTMARPNPGCPSAGDRGEVLSVTFKKQ